MTRTRKRLPPSIRKQQILNAAIQLAQKNSYSEITRNELAAHARVSPPLIEYYFKNMGNLKKQLMRYAIEFNIIDVVAQGFLAKDKYVSKISIGLKRNVIRFLKKQ